MNTYVYTIFCIFFILFIQQVSFTQNCEGEVKNITTNPDKYVNGFKHTECEDLPIADYDWRVEKFPVGNGFTIPGNEIESPFFNGDNDFIDYIHDEVDFDPNEGWEILRYGFADEVQSVAYLTLYNKYRSIVRVFIAVPPTQGEDYNYLNLTIRFEKPNSEDISALLNPTAGFMRALDKESIPLSTTTKKYYDDQLLFYHADFPVEYDFCSCNATSTEIDILFEKTTSQELSLYGRISGVTQDLASISDSTNFLSDDFLTSVYENQNFETNAGSHTYEAYNDLVGYYDQLRQQKKEYEKQFAGLSILNGLAGTAIDALGSFTLGFKIPLDINLLNFKIDTLPGGKINGKKMASLIGSSGTYFGVGLKKKIDGINKELERLGTTQITHSEIAMTGTLSRGSELPYNAGFLLPGRSDGASKCDKERYPLYNEILGRFALLFTPDIVTRFSNTRSFGWPGDNINEQRWSFTATTQLMNSIDYALNPAAEIDIPKTEILGALYIESIFTTQDTSKWEIFGNGSIVSESYRNDSVFISYMTPLLPLGCLENYTSYFGGVTKEDELNAGFSMVHYSADLKLFASYNFIDNIPGADIPPSTFQIYTYKPENSQYDESAGFINTLYDPFQNTGVNMPYGIYENSLILGDTFFDDEVPGIIGPIPTFNYTIFAWDEIILNGNITTAPGVSVHIIAPNVIINAPAVLSNPNIWIYTGETPYECVDNVPVDIATMINYCDENNNTYKAKDALPQPLPTKKATTSTDNTNADETIIVKRAIPFSARIFPNPVGDFDATLSVILPEEGVLSAAIFDMQGVQVAQLFEGQPLPQGRHLFDLPSRQLPAGTYVVRLVTAEGVQALRFVK